MPDFEKVILEQRLHEAENAIAMMKSQHTNDLLNVLVMLQDGDYEEAEEYLTESTS